MRVQWVAILVEHKQQRMFRHIAGRILTLCFNKVRVALQIVEKMVHHLMIAIRPHRYLMGSNITKLLKRSQQLWYQSKTNYHTFIVRQI